MRNHIKIYLLRCTYSVIYLVARGIYEGRITEDTTVKEVGSKHCRRHRTTGQRNQNAQLTTTAAMPPGLPIRRRFPSVRSPTSTALPRLPIH